jgi:hypothetical protein
MDLEMRMVFKTWKARALFATSLVLALSVSGSAQTLDTAKLDRLLDRLAEKNKAMGSLVIAKDGNVLTPAPSATARSTTADDKFQLFNGIVTFEFGVVKSQMILKRGPLPMIFTKDK